MPWIKDLREKDKRQKEGYQHNILGIYQIILYNNMRQETNILKKRKEELRKELFRRLREQEPSQRKERSEIIQKKLLSCEEFQDSKTVMIYVSLPTEVSTERCIREALRQGKRLAVPYIEPQGTEIIAFELNSMEYLEKGPFGIYQPRKDLGKSVPLKEIDVIVVPAVAFDKKNMRLGRGKGYYDRFLSNEQLAGASTVGLAYNFQIVDSVPSDSYDIPVSRVITD